MWYARFQSTLPREERLMTVSLMRQGQRNFNPRSHERSDNDFQNVFFSRSISIHAPTRGATATRQKKRSRSLFQSTLPREERRIVSFFTGILDDFNPRSHERSDYVMVMLGIAIGISIHAPTRGATEQTDKDML